MSQLDYASFDADNHYYEATDAFTRYLDPRKARQLWQWVEMNGRTTLLVCGKVNRFIPNPTFDPVAKPGCLDQFFRGNNPKNLDIRAAFGELEPIRAEYRDRDARIQRMDAQGLQACFLFPTLGVGMEHATRHDAAATHDLLHAFNQWLDEDWGFHYRDRIFAAPLLSLMDLDRAVEELEWVLSRDARLIHVRAAPVPGAQRRSLGDPLYDSFWARVNEAGITVSFHAGESGYGEYAEHWGEAPDLEAFKGTPFRGVTQTDRAIYDAIAALIIHGVFERFPRVRALSVENGSDWVHSLLRKLEKSERMSVGAFSEPPVDTFQRHVTVAPYYEEDVRALADLIGVDRVVMGSDWPHAEGLPEPLDFLQELNDFDEKETRLVMRENARRLATPGAGPA